MKRTLMASAIALALLAGPAQAYDWLLTAKVTSIETSYMPENLLFYIDQQAGSCPSGASLRWNIRGSDQSAKSVNAQAELSTLLSAEMTGHTVTIYGNNTDCSVDYIYING